MRRRFLARILREGALVLLLSLPAACGRAPDSASSAAPAAPVEDWRVTIHLPHVQLPVALHLAADGSEAWFGNGAEKVMIPEITRDEAGWTLRFPSFNNELRLRPTGQGMSGSLTLRKRGYEQVMEVAAHPDPGFRFVPDPQPEVDLTGRWEVTFTEDDGTQSFAVGEFDQHGARLTGTFLTAKGDYRYLAGEVDGRTMYLSAFDGAHAFVFTARARPGGELSGDFWSGTRWHERWEARRNFDARLPDPYSLTYLKEGYERLEFTFPDLDGQLVSLSNERFRDQVVLVCLAGSWCPNCGDAAQFLSEYHRQNRDRGLAVVTLLYEHVDGFARAAAQGRAYRAKYGIEHDILIAGVSDKQQAAGTLPMLNHVLAFPTMIFVDRQGRVRHIYTGYSGPGTGSHHEEFKASFGAVMEKLLDG